MNNIKENYQIKMEHIIANIPQNSVPKLMLQACCAPCSSYVLEILSNYFQITIVYYNPNIYPYEEYIKRLDEVKKLIKLIKSRYPIDILEVEYDKAAFDDISKGLEFEPEGGARCHKCYYLRMEKVALLAKKNNYDYFTTTLSISPYKNAEVLNNIGAFLENKYNIKYLYADFKKKEGYKRSIELSKKYNLYRQEYCGCEFSIQKKEETIS